MAETAKLQLFVKVPGWPGCGEVWGGLKGGSPRQGPHPLPCAGLRLSSRRPRSGRPRGSRVCSLPRHPSTPPTQASEDGESVGHCPSCQRLFMVLLLKGVSFTLTTVDTRRSPDVLKDFAPGSQLPILLYEGDAKTDTLQIEEFLEETLGPPEFPSLAPRYRESTAAGNDVFRKFSAFIKNPVPALDDALYQHLLRALAKLDSYLRAPLEHELAREPQLRESRRRF
eukprot:bmy_14832T0